MGSNPAQGIKSFSSMKNVIQKVVRPWSPITYIYIFSRLVKGPSNNALLSLDLEDHLCDLGVLNKFVDFYPVIQ